ncbi:MAG TPA: ATP-binding cassette domain-containing protein [Myxococcota bacterium]|nr:ATP-binding cassette domain-containing protein [Myxococcota bacterium]
MIARLRERPELQFAGILPRADRALAFAWWGVLLLRGALPALFAVALGAVVAAVKEQTSLVGPLTLFGVSFVGPQVLPPIHQMLGANLGSRVAAWLYDQLAIACVRPAGLGHLESPKLVTDLVVARDFDLGIAGPPMNISMDFIASELVSSVSGLASACVLFAFAWWAPPLLVGAWLATQWLLREADVWRDRNTEQVRQAQRHAEYAYRLAVDPPAAKELRLFGLAGWTVERFRSRRRLLHDLRWEATRLRERPLVWSLAIALAANLFVFWQIGEAALDGRVPVDRLVTFATAALGAAWLAFGGLSWALDGAAAPAAAVLRLQAAMAPAGELARGARSAAGMPAREVRFRDVTFAYPAADGVEREPVLEHFDLAIPAGSSLAIVGVNGAGKTTLAKLLCRLYDPQSGAILVDGVDLRELDVESWRSRVTAVFQDFIRFELPLRDNVAPSGAPDDAVRAALADAGAAQLAELDTILARGYPGGTDLSGGQWQRVALARALCAVRGGAGLVLLDEPTAQLDVRGEAEIFDRILAATRRVTTILISHRFSTVRHADRICVLERGRVVELGAHDELMALRGRYHTMFELQASRFGSDAEEERGLDALE